MDCMYCIENELLKSLMEPIATMQWSKVFLFKDQKYRGRCVVAFNKRHCAELFELNDEERCGFINEVSRVAEAIKIINHANKINYAIYGDLASHVHFHLVPKYVDGPEWGGPFSMDASEVRMNEQEKTEYIQKLKAILV